MVSVLAGKWIQAAGRWSTGLGMIAALVLPVRAQTDFAWQFGNLVNPLTEDGAKATTSILTFQNASSWKYGASFFFLDFINDVEPDFFNDVEFYGEWYPTLSINKIRGKDMWSGPLRDLSLLGGINVDADANVLKLVTGVQLNWSVPGFIFVNTDFTPLIDLSGGIAEGGAPKTDDTAFMFDVSWLLVRQIGSRSFAFTGHAEYISGVTNELGDAVNAWILAQPQFTIDVTGDGWLHAGVELQYWRNKLGSDHNELAPQLLVVLRM